MNFFDTTEEDLKADEQLQFGDKEIVQMSCIDFFENASKGNLTLKCKVMSGPHKDKTTKIYLNSNDNEVSKKVKLQFLKAFWTVDEIKSGNCKGARLIGRKFSVKSVLGKGKGEKANEVYQNWQEFHDLGSGESSSVPPQPANVAAPTPTAQAPAPGAASVAPTGF